MIYATINYKQTFSRGLNYPVMCQKQLLYMTNESFQMK